MQRERYRERAERLASTNSGNHVAILVQGLRHMRRGLSPPVHHVVAHLGLMCVLSLAYADPSHPHASLYLFTLSHLLAMFHALIPPEGPRRSILLSTFSIFPRHLLTV